MREGLGKLEVATISMKALMKGRILSLALAKSLAVALPLAFQCAPAAAEDLQEIFRKVNQLVEDKNYSKAMDELGWAKKEIEKLHLAQLQTYLPDKLAGFDGDTLENNSVMGLTNIERNYTKTGENTSVKISLTGGGKTGGDLGIGNLAALGKMAAALSPQTGSDTIRISGRTAQLTVNKESESAELTVFLDSGTILKLEMSNSAQGDTLKSMAEELKINDLDNYLKG
jgi:hypothetical protein